MNQQTALPLSWPARYGAEDYIVASCNESAWQMVQHPEQWSTPGLILIGEGNSGKTHLAHIFHDAHKAVLLTDRAGMEQALTDEPALLAIDNIDTLLQGDGDVTETIFHLVNNVILRKARLLLTATRPVTEWTALPDLQSRMQSFQQIALPQPDEEMIKASYQKMFSDRGLLVDDKVLDYLSLRSERSFSGVRSIVETLDRKALETLRKITIPFIQSLGIFE